MRDDLISLRKENDQLRETVRQLQELLAPPLPMFLPLRLTGTERRMLQALLARQVRTKAQLMTVLYGHQPDADSPEDQIVPIYICKLRKKLRPFGVEIDTVRGVGFRLSASARERLLALEEASDAT